MNTRPHAKNSLWRGTQATDWHGGLQRRTVDVCNVLRDVRRFGLDLRRFGLICAGFGVGIAARGR